VTFLISIYNPGYSENENSLGSADRCIMFLPDHTAFEPVMALMYYWV